MPVLNSDQVPAITEIQHVRLPGPSIDAEGRRHDR